MTFPRHFCIAEGISYHFIVLKEHCPCKQYLRTYRSSRPEVFFKKGVIKIWSNFTGENPCRSAISIKLLSTLLKSHFCMDFLLYVCCIFSEHLFLTLFRMGGQKAPPPPTSFSPVTSTNVVISPKTFWLLVLTLLPHWCEISSLYLVPVSNYWIWTKATPQQKQFFGQILIKLRLW